MKSQETKEAERTAPDTCTAAPLPMVAPLRMRTLEAENAAFCWMRKRGWGAPLRSMMHLEPKPEHWDTTVRPKMMLGGGPSHQRPPGVIWMCAPSVMVELPAASASHSSSSV
jgi:hypothetical protein